jgi:NAD(P)-dependent dehydrogenase (short-subunit alcohol dehydrogenase family)
VTNTAEITVALELAASKYGHVDVVVNCAGYGLMGPLEGTSEQQMREIMDVNFFGTVLVTKAALKILREKNAAGAGGVIVQMSSMSAINAFPGNAFYHASKFALEGFTQSVAQELMPAWNIDFMLVEPGAVRTAFTGRSLKFAEVPEPYNRPDNPALQTMKYVTDPKLMEGASDPVDIARVIVKLVAGRGSTKLPLRLPMGKDGYDTIMRQIQDLTAQMESMKEYAYSVSKT